MLRHAWFWHLLSKRQNHMADCAIFVAFSEKLNFINIVLKKCVPFLVHLLFCRPFSQVLQCRVWTNLYHCLFAFSWKVPLLHHRANLLPLTISTVLNIWKEKESQVKNSVNFFKLRKNSVKSHRQFQWLTNIDWKIRTFFCNS